MTFEQLQVEAEKADGIYIDYFLLAMISLFFFALLLAFITTYIQKKGRELPQKRNTMTTVNAFIAFFGVVICLVLFFSITSIGFEKQTATMNEYKEKYVQSYLDSLEYQEEELRSIKIVEPSLDNSIVRNVVPWKEYDDDHEPPAT